jgi:hypothetical protein
MCGRRPFCKSFLGTTVCHNRPIDAGSFIGERHCRFGCSAQTASRRRRIDGVYLKNSVGKIQTNCANLHLDDPFM